MLKRYRNVSRRRLVFPDHQIVLPGEAFERDYTPQMEFHHLVAGLIVEEDEVLPSEPVAPNLESEGEE